MKTTGVYRCGQEGEINLYVDRKKREWVANQIFSEICNDCKNAEAAAKAKEMGLPELTGSEKQIAWANTIRQDMLGKLERREMLGLFLRTGRVTEENIETAISGLRMETSSRWFIDHRDDDSLEIVAAFVPEVQA